MKLIIALVLASASLVASAQTWLDYMNSSSQTVQQEPRPSYSEQYNAGYMDGYLRAHGYAAVGDRNGRSYGQGYDAARHEERHQW